MIGVWYGVHHLVLEPNRRFLLPPPHDVFKEGFLDSETRGDLIDALLATSYLAFVGLLIAVVLGISTAIFMNSSKLVERGLFPWVVALQVMPVFVLIPLINIWFQNLDTWFLWFDANFKKRLIVCILIAFFPIIINTHFGLSSVDRNLDDLFRLHKSRRFTRLTKLEFRAAVPSIFVGLRIAAGLAVIGAIVAEFLIPRGYTGIGNLISRYSGNVNYEELIATLLISSLLGVVIYWGLSLVGNVLTRNWHASTQDYAI